MILGLAFLILAVLTNCEGIPPWVSRKFLICGLISMNRITTIILQIAGLMSDLIPSM